MSDELETYFTRIEEYFGKCRGASLLLSTRDFKRVKKWYEEDIPLEVVFKGIDRYFENVDPEDRKNRVVLSYAKRHIQKAWEEAKESRVGKGEDREETDSLDPSDRLEELSSELKNTLQKLDNTEIEEIIEKALSELKDIEVPESDIETIESELAQVNDSMMEKIQKHCPDIEEIREEASDLLDGFDERVDGETYKNMVRNQVRKLLREKYGIPDLTLFLF